VNFCLYIVTEGVQYFIILSSKNFYSFKPSNKLGKIIPTFQKKKCIKKYQKLYDRFGFDERFCNWIREILHLAKLLILVNWKAVGYFNCAHAVWDDDPLSPLFLCIVKEILSRSLSNLANNGNICPMNLCRGLQFLLMRFYHVQLVPSIIYGKVIYSFHVYLWPKNILKKLDSWFRNFVWSGDVSMRKIYNVALKQICVSYITGCLDLWPL
jgi:hypothetical protein